jgi:hypothetical protein
MSLGGGNKGGSTDGLGQPVNIPPFLSAGGITPQQGALADFTYGEGLDATGNEFGGAGTGQSTMATQAAGGANFAKAEQTGQMSDVNQTADYARYQGDVSNELQGLATQANLNMQDVTQQQQALGTDANALGKLFGSSSGTFGGATA